MNKSNDDEYALSLWLEELDIARESTFQKNSVGSDVSIAVELFQNELNKYHQTVHDRKVAASLSQACESDGEILDAFRQFEVEAAQDHALAVRLSMKTSGKTGSSKNQMNVGASSSKDNFKVHSSSPKEQCVSCMDPIENCSFKKFPCDHMYCEECFTELVKTSLSDISLIPIRCCKKDVPQEWVVSVLSPDPAQLNRYLEVRESQSSSYVAKILDPEYEKSVINLGLKICPKCRRGVEKSHGCVHMTCLCRHQFCYNCGANWIPTRECSCDLFTRTEIDQMINDRPELNEVQRMNLANVLRHHDAHVHTWRKVIVDSFNQYARCQICNWECDRFFHTCDGCLETRCTRCKLNRD